MEANTVNVAKAGTIMIGADLEVNRFGYGAMRLTGEGIWGPPKDKKEAIKVLKTCIDLGINFIDTADSYGPNVSEALIAEALYPYPKDLIIATKGGLIRTGPNQWPVNGRPDHLKEALEGSLKRLKKDQIDLYQLHRIDDKVPVAETIGFLKDSQDKGLIRHIGLSEVSVAQIKEVGQWITVVSIQNQYNLFQRQWEKELKYAEENSLVFIPWFPLSSGKFDQKKVIDDMAKKYEVNTIQLMLAWLLAHSKTILPIAGTSSSDHLKENVLAASLELDPQDIEKLSHLS